MSPPVSSIAQASRSEPGAQPLLSHAGSYSPLGSPASLGVESCTKRETFIRSSRSDILRIVGGTDPRLLVVVGPCSIDDPEAALLYAHELRCLQNEVADELLLCMRTYFEKPRTTVGWKGWFSDPHADGSHAVEHGLRTGLALLRQLAELGLATATELLDPLFLPYVSPWVSWAAVGARTTESQVHRQAASNLPYAVGFKNGTDGSVEVAIAAMQSAAASHTFPAVCDTGHLQLVRSVGNPGAHVVLRGGASGTNYDELSVARIHHRLREANARHTRVMIDCSHGNSNKDYRNQPTVLEAVARQVQQAGPIFGVMLESYLLAGNQAIMPREQRRIGQSVTDGCIDFATTRQALIALARAVKSRSHDA